MVDLYEFHCDSCRYSVIASGRDSSSDDYDMGKTILCENCQTLYEIEPENSFTIKMSATKKRIRCPESFSHQIKIWKHPGPCPKCGRTMRKGDLVVKWD